MPQVVEPVRDAPERTSNRVRWTRSQCAAVQEAGILTGRYELIDGDIISKMAQKPPHAAAIGLLLEWLASVFGAGFVRVQTTADAGGGDPEHNEPEPDLAVTRDSVRSYVARHPGPEDLLLVVEVSDTTLRFDLTTKAALYALSSIREYWVLDLNGCQLLVHRGPSPEGYQEVTAYSAEESVATLARPEAAVRVADLLP